MRKVVRLTLIRYKEVNLSVRCRSPADINLRSFVKAYQCNGDHARCPSPVHLRLCRQKTKSFETNRQQAENYLIEDDSFIINYSLSIVSSTLPRLRTRSTTVVVHTRASCVICKTIIVVVDLRATLLQHRYHIVERAETISILRASSVRLVDRDDGVVATNMHQQMFQEGVLKQEGMVNTYTINRICFVGCIFGQLKTCAVK
jgi:hypothetical protein